MEHPTAQFVRRGPLSAEGNTYGVPFALIPSPSVPYNLRVEVNNPVSGQPVFSTQQSRGLPYVQPGLTTTSRPSAVTTTNTHNIAERVRKPGARRNTCMRRPRQAQGSQHINSMAPELSWFISKHSSQTRGISGDSKRGVSVSETCRLDRQASARPARIS